MNYKKLFVPVALTLLLLFLPSALRAESSTNVLDAPSGVYQIDPAHTRITFRVSHLGFSYYTGRFDSIDGKLVLNTTSPEDSTLNIAVTLNSINLGDGQLEDDLRGNRWFNIIEYPYATFHVTKIVRTGARAGEITGDLTLLGTTHSILLNTTMIGTGTGPLFGKQVIGFSASGLIHRSDFNLTNLLPMIGNDVTLEIDAEFDKID